MEYYRIVEPARVILPPLLEQPFECLGQLKRAYFCDEDECHELSISRDAIRKHCNKAHDWKSTAEQRTYWHQVWVQTFFNAAGLQRYFTVDHEERDSPTEDDESRLEGERSIVTSTGGTRVQFSDILQKWDQDLNKHQKALEVADAETAKTNHTLWFKRTEWPEHLAGCNLRHLSRMSRLPDKEEQLLQRAVELNSALIEKCVTGLTSLDRETQRWLRSAKLSEPDQRPLARLQNTESQQTYSTYMARLLCYSLRVLQSDRDRRQSEEAESEAVISDSMGDEDDDDHSSSSSSSCEDDEDYRSEPVVDVFKDARRLYPWQGRQKELLGVVRQSIAGGWEDKAQVKALLDFYESLIFQKVRGDTFKSAVMHFLAVLGIDEEMIRLRSANDFSYMLAGVVYCTRVLAVEVILPSEHWEEQEEEDDRRFRQMRDEYLADGTYSVFSKMLSLLAYGKSIALDHNNAGAVSWSLDRSVMSFRGRQIRLERIGTMIRDVITEAESKLWTVLMWTTSDNRFEIPLEQLEDDVTFTKRGISFITNRANALEDKRRWMLERAFAHADGQKLYRGGVWSKMSVRKYLRQVDRFRELLLFCIHVTGGQPARGSEITTIRFRNGFLQDRNVFVIQGQMAVVTRYHKSQSQFDKPKVIPGFLPWQVGQLLAVYLAYVQPFQEYLSEEVRGFGFSDYVWSSEYGAWGTDRLTRIIVRETQKRLGVRLTTLEYRHVAISVGREVVGEQFARGYIEGAGEAEEAEVDEDDALEMSAGRGGEIGANRYGVSLDVIKHLSSRSIDTFRPLRVLEKWRSGGSMTVGTSSGSWFFGGEATPTVEQTRRSRVISEEEVKQAMGKVLRTDEVSFRSAAQRDALHAVVSKDDLTPLVIVLPTGGGKSMLFMAPACLDDPGVTVVVVPYRALLDNLLSTAKKAGIDCMEWQPGEVNPAALVLVSADKVVPFMRYAGVLGEKGLLRRVFVDESHLTFTSSNWRPKLTAVREVRGLKVPTIMLTATLPVVLEFELEASMAAQMARYIRVVTTRMRTRYVVDLCPAGKGIERTMELCGRMQKHLGTQKGVVYSRSRKQCEQLAKELNCAYYHAGAVDNQERLDMWLRRGGLIVATSALGTGVDFPGIVFVLHVDMPYGMIDFAQESGRAGRGGEDVDSIIVVEEGRVEPVQGWNRGGLEVDQRTMGEFITTRGCRRRVMGWYLDGVESECPVAGTMAQCDRCGAGLTELERGRVRAARERQMVEEMLDEVVEGCVSCFVGSGEDARTTWEHRRDSCERYPVGKVLGDEAFRRNIRFEGGSDNCFGCGFSQKVCRTGIGVSKGCQWPGVMGGLLVGMVKSEGGMVVLQQVGMRVREGDWEGYKAGSGG
ncbi:hypothetical protein B0A55_07939 [Friedmanniomyces simplex]|uniref:DNA 3'-5' helicase n=1 Tax=Friedmanniomyces simplex TaxID=329884 RepID=A0A4U0XFC7_9PEZI|nr:hypothetical protein B0A55_07939 [Friedmanniomyces simplex]